MTQENRSAGKLVFSNPAAFLAFGLGSGLSPFAPGTMGTLAAIPFAVVLKTLPLLVYAPLLAALFVLGIYLCDVTERRLGQHDPGGIVWDEMVAYWLTVMFLPVHWAWFLAAFVLFRIFDILKPWPIRLVERRFGGGLGIMLDDIVAALYAMLILFLAGSFIPAH